MPSAAVAANHATLAATYAAVRQRSLTLCAPLTPEDMMVQSCPEASPAKWHLAHTAWFFESFVLTPFLSGYQPFHKDFYWLFNSYYATFAYFPEKKLRASFSRPTLDEVLHYRAHVDEAIARLLAADAPSEALRRIDLGINHEEQHQELLLTDILHAFFTNPLRPAYCTEEKPLPAMDQPPAPLEFLDYAGGLRRIGHEGERFCYDNELPRHQVWLEPYKLASRLITCGEYAEFIADGGYRRQDLWFSAGWDAVQAQGWQAPLYWTEREGEWTIFTLRGALPLEAIRSTPVAHVSFFEADAYARWAGARLATEFEWEAASDGEALSGNLLESGLLLPAPALNQNLAPTQWVGDVWEWTASAYLGYPGYKAASGALGEYNGKFMSGQMVLRGGSCVTPTRHIRASYRNFFVPETRWQFSGIRLAK
ncbi:ergothioneine biosynthesis protein EgtB [Telmatobacter bradus]|uniref:ergothioneine biosynthesis protein EgtB n=1 Tax=Telmatobacter bradus TaxID=474953 RepID=UPI003B42DFDE